MAGEDDVAGPAHRQAAAPAPQLDIFAAFARMQQPFFRLWETDPLTGKPDQDVSKWFENFEYLAEVIDNLTDNDKVIELRKAARGRAADILRGATVQERASYAAAKALLQGRLIQPHQQLLYRQQFATRS